MSAHSLEVRSNASGDMAAHPPAPDYADPADWACRPERDSDCTSGLGAVLLGPDGSGIAQPFIPAAAPPIDCFYIYPTTSREPQDYAEVTPGPAVMATVRSQAGRLASQCRLYVPLYRQATLYHLHNHPGPDWGGPYQDIVAAWTYYMAHDNDGRGVVIIGHSQGTILLQRLIAEHVDGKPAQAQLVSAFLIGNPGLQVPPGGTVGGTFKHIPICTASSQTGCAYSWASYLSGDARDRAFGQNKAGLVAACTNPANPGGTGVLHSYFPQKDFPSAADAPFIAVTGQISAVCESDSRGSVLRITIRPGRYASALQSLLNAREPAGVAKDWGLHRYDIALAQGSILKLISAETSIWRQTHR